MRMINSARFLNFSIVLSLCLASVTAHACTRAVYLGPENTVLTSRSMDWTTDVGSNVWVFPRTMARDGAAGAANGDMDARVTACEPKS